MRLDYFPLMLLRQSRLSLLTRTSLLCLRPRPVAGAARRRPSLRDFACLRDISAMRWWILTKLLFPVHLWTQVN